jgi:hypothetical protein
MAAMACPALATAPVLLSRAEQDAILAQVLDQVVAVADAAGIALTRTGWVRKDTASLFRRRACLLVTDPLQPVAPGHMSGYALFVDVKCFQDGSSALFLEVSTHDMSFQPPRMDVFRAQAPHALSGVHGTRPLLRSAALQALQGLVDEATLTRLAQQAVDLLVRRWAP